MLNEQRQANTATWTLLALALSAFQSAPPNSLVWGHAPNYFNFGCQFKYGWTNGIHLRSRDYHRSATVNGF